MAPKVAAAIQFAVEMDRPAGIGKLEDASAIVRGEKGTLFDPHLSANARSAR
jgi:carbamate kinase